VLIESLTDLLVEPGDPGVDRADLFGERGARYRSPGKCLCLGADRTFDKPYSPRPRHFLYVNDQGQPTTGESPRLTRSRSHVVSE
jgi:hypothetical protein